MMYKLLVADDDAVIRQGIVRSFDWESLNCTIVGEADNGATALELIETLSPDIVICDIQMPVLDGVHIARKIREMQYDMKIIFVTGYEEFEYAREAVKNWVFDYILKPVDAELLKSAVEGARNALELSRRVREENEKFRSGLESFKPALRESFILQLIREQLVDRGEVAEKAAFFDMSRDYYQLILIELDNSGDKLGTMGEYERQLLLFTIKNLIGAASGSQGAGYIVDTDVNRMALLLAADEIGNSIPMMDEAIGVCRSSLGVSLSCGLSEWFVDLAETGHYYRQAVNAVAHKFYLGAGSVTHIQDLHRMQLPAGSGPDYAAAVKTLIRQLNADNVDGLAGQAAKLLESVFKLEDNAQRNIDSDKSVAIDFMACMARELESAGFDSFPLLAAQQAYAQILRFETLDDIVRYVGELLPAIVSANEKQRNQSYHLVVERAVEFINANYTQNIALNDVAAHVHMNASYLSRIIKKITGSNFVDILLQARIEQAKVLLRQIHYKTYEVAELVGIPDSKYFSSVFKRETGLTPTEYRHGQKGRS